MTATELIIQAKHPDKYLASLDKFTVINGESLDGVQLLNHPNITLYCLDDKQKRAIFVETPKTVNLYKAPFFYQAQFEHANKLFALSYGDFIRLARIMPAPKKLVFLYSLGRCGSTLLSHCFNQLTRTLSVSEPDVFTHLTGLRDVGRVRDAELQVLAQACTAFLCKPAPDKKPSRFVFKLRGFSIELADLLHEALPKAKNLFLYRNLDDWLRSMARLSKTLFYEKEGLTKHSLPTKMFGIFPRENFISYYRSLPNPLPELNKLERFSLSWLSMMNRYLATAKAGVPFLAVRYEDLISQSKFVLENVFAYCGFETANIKRALEPFERDSQANTSFSGQENRLDTSLELSEAHLEQARAVLTLHAEITKSDYVLPHTLKVHA